MAHETCKTLSKNSSTNIWYQSLWPVSSALSASGFPILDFCLKALVHMEPCCGMPCLEAQPLRCHLWQCFSQRKIQGQIVYVVIQSTWLFSFWFLYSCMQQRDNKLSKDSRRHASKRIGPHMGHADFMTGVVLL